MGQSSGKQQHYFLKITEKCDDPISALNGDHVSLVHSRIKKITVFLQQQQQVSH